MGCGWNPICHIGNAATATWDWLSGNGPASWIRGLLGLIVIIGLFIIGIALFVSAPVWVQIGMLVVGAGFLGIVVYDISTRNSKKS